MASFSKGTSFTDGVTGDVTAAKLHALVDAATPVPGLITDRTAETSVASDDLVLISNTSDSGALNKMTVANLMKAELTGTINSTAGTIATLNSTTGTIPTLTSTTLLTTGTGTAASPAIVPTGDTNTGIFFPAADTIAATTNGTERVRIDSSGNVGIGSTSLSKKLTVYSDNSTAYSSSDFDSARNLLIQNANTTTNANVGVQFLVGANSEAAITAIRTADGTADLAFGTRGGGSRAERLRIDSSGNVGIGTTPSKPLHVKSSSAAEILRLQSPQNTGQAFFTFYKNNGNLKGIIGYGSAVNEEFFIQNDENSPMSFYNNGSERLRITSDGYMLLAKNTTSLGTVGYRFDPTGESFVSLSASANTTITNAIYSTGASAYRFYVGMAGTVFATNTTISAISDARLKENIRDMDSGLQSILALKPRLFDWKEGKGADKKNVRGFIAQEIEQVFPDLVDEWKDPAPEGEEPYKSVRQDLIPVLVKAIQELKAENDSIKSRIEALEAA